MSDSVIVEDDPRSAAAIRHGERLAHRDRHGVQQDPRATASLPVVYADVHPALTSRFRFAIFFEIVEERTEIGILAVLHQRRDPALWPKR